MNKKKDPFPKHDYKPKHENKTIDERGSSHALKCRCLKLCQVCFLPKDLCEERYGVS